MTFEELNQYLKDPSHIEAQHLSDLMLLSQQYEYCAPLHLLILICLYRTNDLRFASELHRRILYVTNPKELYFTMKETYSHRVIHKQEQEKNTEESLGSFDIINNFLEDYPDDTSEIEQILVHLHEDKLQEESTSESSAEIIDKFLSKGESVEIIIPSNSVSATANRSMPLAEDEVQTVNDANNDELFTETLARIYIRQGKYDQALRIFKTLNLKYSKKNSYFAEQIAFLEKLVKNATK